MPVTPTGDWAGRSARTTTDQDGRYEFGELYAFHVKIQVRAPSFSRLASTYWPDAYSFATAGTLRVAASGSTADVDLPVGGSISGRVVDARSGAPILGARVLAHVDAPPGWEPVGSAGLAPGPGQFVIDGVPPVPVALEARAGPGSNHLGQWYAGVGSFGAAQRVQPGTSGLVIALPEGGQVSGVVRDDLGGAVPGAAVTIVGCPGLCPMSTRADDSGAYRINGIPAGPGLRAYADAAAAGLLGGWYTAPGQSGDSTFDLGSGQELGDVDFALTAGALAFGRVLDAQTGEPISGVSVELVDVGDSLNSYVSQGVDGLGGRPPEPTADPMAPSPGAEPTATPSVAGPGHPPRPSVPVADLVIGPVPPGEYSVIIYPGSDNADYVPVELAGSSGLDGPGLLDLARAERVEFTVSLARPRMPRAAGAPTARAGPARQVGTQPEPPGSAGWPGLFGGFLVAADAGFLRLRA